MKSQLPDLSALLDGELEPHEVPVILKAAVRERELRGAWRTYALIGDQLRQGCPGARDLTASVMAKIRAEPVVLAPRNLQLTGRHHPWLALAASVAGVAVVGWLALVGNPQSLPATSRLAAVPPAPTFARATGERGPQPQVAVAAAARGDMSEYLLAHHTQASSFRLGDSAGYARTVTLTGGPARP